MPQFEVQISTAKQYTGLWEKTYSAIVEAATQEGLVEAIQSFKVDKSVSLKIDPNAKLGAANTSCPQEVTVKMKGGEVIEARLGGFVYRVEADCKAVCVESTKDSTSYEIDLPPITSEGETDGES